MRTTGRVVLFAALVAAGTILGGWWTVPLLAVLWARVMPTRGLRRSAAAGAALGWAGILAWSASHEPVLPLATKMSEVLGLPPWGFTAATLLFPALLAAAAADLSAPDRR
jgi:hypothetical protein